MKFDTSKHPDSQREAGLIGTFQDFRLTFGSCGHQFTTIDGQVFITWFDFLNPALKGLRPGCRVEYETRSAPTVLRHSPRVEEPLASATLLRVVPEAGISTPHPNPLPDRGGEGERKGA